MTLCMMELNWNNFRGDHTRTVDRGWWLATGFQVSLQSIRPTPADHSTDVTDQAGWLIALLSLLLPTSDLGLAWLPQP